MTRALFNALFQKYSAEGNLIFWKYFNNNININSEGNFVTIDPNENPIIGFTQWNNGQTANVIKYSSSGDSLWAVTFNDDTSSYSVRYLLTDLDKNVYALLAQGYPDGGDLRSSRCRSC